MMRCAICMSLSAERLEPQTTIMSMNLTDTSKSKLSSQCRLRTVANRSDVDAVREIVASTRFFSPAEVDVAVELIEDRLAKVDASDYQFIFADVDSRTIGYSCFGPIACTVGSYDLYWIAVHEEFRGGGLGRRLLA